VGPEGWCFVVVVVVVFLVKKFVRSFCLGSGGCCALDDLAVVGDFLRLPFAVFVTFDGGGGGGGSMKLAT
jgi:hypothetical protein